MKVYLDGLECTDIAGDGGASSVLSAVQSRVAETGRVLVEIRLDDVVMDEEAFTGVSGGLAVYFTSQPVRELVRESLDDAVQYIPRLTKGLEEIALHFEQNEFGPGEGKLADGVEGLDWLLQVFQKCKSLMAVDNADNDGLRELQDSLADSIGSIAALHSEKKYTQMAFSIRQKLVPEIEKFSVYVQRLFDLASSTQ